MGWLDVLGQVAQVSAQVIPLFAGNEELGEGAQMPTYEMGPVSFGVDPKSLQAKAGLSVMAQNHHTGPVNLLFSRPAIGQHEGPQSVKLQLEPNDKGVDVSDHLRYFGSGALTIAPRQLEMPPLSASDGNTEQVRGTYQSCGLNETFHAFGGITFEVIEKQQKYVAVFSSEEDKIKRIELTVRDIEDQAARTFEDFPASPTAYEVEIPKGVKFAPYVKEISVGLDIEV